MAPRYVGCKYLARLGPDNLCGVDRPPRDEDERPGRPANLSLPDQKEELSLKDVEQLIAAVVNVARWPGPGGCSRLDEPDRASGFLAGRFEHYAPYGSAFAWPEDDTPWGVCPLFLRIRFAHGVVSPLEVGTIYIILVFLYDPLPWWANSYSEAYCYPARHARRRSIHRDAERNCPKRRVAVTGGRRVQAPEARTLGGGWRRRGPGNHGAELVRFLLSERARVFEVNRLTR